MSPVLLTELSMRSSASPSPSNATPTYFSPTKVTVPSPWSRWHIRSPILKAGMAGGSSIQLGQKDRGRIGAALVVAELNLIGVRWKFLHDRANLASHQLVLRQILGQRNDIQQSNPFHIETVGAELFDVNNG